MMNPTPFRYFLFPHMTLHERDSRHLSLLVPHLTMLQVLRPPIMPEWARDHFATWPVIKEHEHVEQIKLYLKGYQDFADLHGEESVLASMSHNWIEKQLGDSRFMIQSELRGKNAPPPEIKESLFMEAAVFMEMARDLDEREMELEENFRHAESLEDDFREILGVADEEDFDEAIETLSPPLVSDGAGLSFMLPRRICFWFRMFHSRVPEDSPVLVAVSNEVIEELIDPLRTECDRMGQPLGLVKIPLASLPSLERLEAETFEAIHRELCSSQVLTSYWESLDDVLRNPVIASSRERLDGRARDLADLVTACCERVGHHERRQVSLTLTCTEGCSQGDLWRCIDRPGHSKWAVDSGFQPPPSLLLSLD